jgi:hypothetical protein
VLERLDIGYDSILVDVRSFASMVPGTEITATVFGPLSIGQNTRAIKNGLRYLLILNKIGEMGWSSPIGHRQRGSILLSA